MTSPDMPNEGAPGEGCTGRASLTAASRLGVDGMDARNEAREFLMSRRANLTPEQAGLPVSGHRRVEGLRRDAVAMLADVSPEYYAKIERGHLAGVSDAVLESVARALQLDDAEQHSDRSTGAEDDRRRAGRGCVPWSCPESSPASVPARQVGMAPGLRSGFRQDVRAGGLTRRGGGRSACRGRRATAGQVVRRRPAWCGRNVEAHGETPSRRHDRAPRTATGGG